jgi:Anti-sigma-K factor rskA/Putative zinc-finger
MSEDRFGELLGPYVLGELTAEEERELVRHLEECPSCWADLSVVMRVHNVLREAAASQPPPELKARMLARATEESSVRSGYGWKLWVPIAAALLVASVLGFGILRAVLVGPSDGIALASTAQAPGAGGEVRVEEVGQNLQVELEVWNLPKLREGEYYEMWYYAEDGGRISCGTFRTEPEGRTTVNLSAPASARAYPEIEITREPDDGNPGASGEEVLIGHLVDL